MGGSPQHNSHNIPQQLLSQIDQLKYLLKKIKYNKQLHTKDFLSGQLNVYIPIVYFTMMVYSKLVSKFIEQQGFVLQMKNDQQFMEDIYRILDIHFAYKAQLGLNQFFNQSQNTLFIEQKLQFCIDLINLVKSRHHQLGKRSSSVKENMNQHYQVPKKEALPTDQRHQIEDQQVAKTQTQTRFNTQNYTNESKQNINMTDAQFGSPTISNQNDKKQSSKPKKSTKNHDAQQKGTKSVRFVESKQKQNQDEKAEEQKQGKAIVNQTIDNSQREHKLSVIEIDQYLRRAGSPQPESTYQNKRYSLGDNLRYENNFREDYQHKIARNYPTEQMPNSTRHQPVQIKDALQIHLNNGNQDLATDLSRKIESQRQQHSKNIIFNNKNQSKQDIDNEKDKKTAISTTTTTNTKKFDYYNMKEPLPYQQETKTILKDNYPLDTYLNRQAQNNTNHIISQQPKTLVQEHLHQQNTGLNSSQYDQILKKNKELESTNYVEEKFKKLEKENRELKSKIQKENSDKKRHSGQKQSNAAQQERATTPVPVQLLSPDQNQQNTENRRIGANVILKDDKIVDRAVDNIQQQYSNRYKSEKRYQQPSEKSVNKIENSHIDIQNNKDSSKYTHNSHFNDKKEESHKITQKQIDESYIQNLRKNYPSTHQNIVSNTSSTKNTINANNLSQMAGSNGFSSTRGTDQLALSNGLRATGDFRPTGQYDDQKQYQSDQFSDKKQPIDTSKQTKNMSSSSGTIHEQHRDYIRQRCWCSWCEYWANQSRDYQKCRLQFHLTQKQVK
eukprot:403331811